MKTVGIAWVAGALVLAAGWWEMPTAKAAKSEPSGTAAKLVAETLEREATEGVDDRAEALASAREQKPPCEEAFWQSGYVFEAKQKKWLTRDEVEKLSGDDAQLAEYAKTREKYKETEGDQAVLARWCAKRKLDEPSRAHWTQVLNFSPENGEARRALGFRQINGRWISAQQAAEGKAQAAATEASLHRWSSKLDDLLRKLSNPQSSNAAHKELLAIKDPDVVPAVAAFFFSQNEELALVGIEMLENLPSRPAAAVLAFHAAFSPWMPVGQAAAAALRGQEKYDYVPLLLEAAEMPVVSPSQVAGTPGVGGGGDPNAYEPKVVYRIQRTTQRYSYHDVQQLGEHPLWYQIPTMRFNAATPDPVAKKTAGTVQKANSSTTVNKREYFTVRNDRLQEKHTDTQVTTNTKRLVRAGTILVPKNPQQWPYPQQQKPWESPGTMSEEMQKSQPLRALSEATGERRPKTVSDWWDWWYDYNEVYHLSVNPMNGVPGQEQTADELNSAAGRGDCLAAGTLVAGEIGPVAVEKLAVGDRVFCCDSETGCLALKAVVRKTIRLEGKVWKIRVGGEEIEACGGHLFWVAGKGWVKARELREGMPLHTIRGTVAVESVEEGEQQTAFSVATADFHTFFVGKDAILTHDNTIHPPTERLVPGLATEKETKAAQKGKKAS